MWSLQLCLQFKQSQVSQKNVFRAATGFEPMASALALQCSTNWAMNTHMLGAGQFVEFIVPMKGMKQGMNGFESRWSPKNIFQAHLRLLKLCFIPFHIFANTKQIYKPHAKDKLLCMNHCQSNGRYLDLNLKDKVAMIQKSIKFHEQSPKNYS